MDQHNYVIVQDGHDYNTSNLQSFASNMPQTQFSGENLEEVYRFFEIFLILLGKELF